MKGNIIKLIIGYCTVLSILFYLNLNFSMLSVPMVVVGLCSWFFAEYTVNRWVVHSKNLPKLVRRAFTANHAVHHRFPLKKKNLSLPFSFTFVISMLLGSAVLVVSGSSELPWFYLGLTVGGFYYEFCHYAAHHLNIQNSYFIENKRRHMLHHSTHPDSFYGITNGFLDAVFGTGYEKAKPFEK